MNLVFKFMSNQLKWSSNDAMLPINKVHVNINWCPVLHRIILAANCKLFRILLYPVKTVPIPNNTYTSSPILIQSNEQIINVIILSLYTTIMDYPTHSTVWLKISNSLIIGFRRKHNRYNHNSYLILRFLTHNSNQNRVLWCNKTSPS